MERIAFEYRKDEPFRVVKDGCVGTIRCMEGGGVSKYIMEIERLGNIFGEDKGTGYAGNVWNKSKLCPTLQTMQGGYREPMIIDEVKELGFMDNGTGKHQSNTVVDENGLAPTVTTVNGGGTQQIKVLTEQSIVRMIGRNPENPSDRTVGAPTEQRLEPNSQGICNTLTSVKKDNLVMEVKAIDEQNMCVRDETFGTLTTDGSSPKHNNRVMECVETQYRIRKLTPRECYRLMAVPEKDIDKMLEVNSNTQCYKQAGNSIVVNCLIAIFSQMGIQGIPRWNEGLSEKYK